MIIIHTWRLERKGYAPAVSAPSRLSRRTTGARFWITTTWLSILRPVQP